ncbi:MAG TPA: hypothetical protein VII41_18625 [Steroidobacteraceae bacterium]
MNGRPDYARRWAPDNAPANAPKELLDEKTGTTLIVVRRPLVLARSRTDVAANVRDYATLVATQEDEAGHFLTWLIVHRWSTVDSRIDTASRLDSGNLLLIADGRPLALGAAQQLPMFATRGDLLYAPRARASTWAYKVELPLLRYVAAARDLSLRFVDDPYPVSYSVWDDGRQELQGLLDDAIGPAAGPH